MKKTGKYINCNVCNASIYITPHQYNKAKYCSVKCFRIDTKALTKNCLICNKEFMPRSNINKGYGKYCSLACSGVNLKKKCFINHCKFNDQITRKHSKLTWLNIQGFKAQECHNLDCKKKSKFYVNVFIDDDLSKNRIKNCAQLCRGCLTKRGTHHYEPTWNWEKINEWQGTISKNLLLKMI